ncbi:transcriptional regulator [Dendryphion nanum]|uniref:Transcriptional regulator n=1 Tax=Dendryphion nanum TaxID=256645 RepID=A0A9P9IEQ6_9PLEO|nr:transcriptional regulator [Dendryphion nanum]
MALHKVAVYMFPGGDLLDFSGPVEIYSAQPVRTQQNFEITSFAHHNPIKPQSNALVYVPNNSFEEMETKIDEYDILVIPGSHGDVIRSLIASKEGRELSALIKRFASLPPRKQGGKRFLQSVCTGAILLAASGVLFNRTVTTHHLDFDLLKEVADQAAGGDSKVTIVRKRWVDAGTTDAGVTIVNAGGVSSGIDTSLWIYEQFVGKEAADWVAEVAEFQRRSEPWGATF